MWPDPEMLRKLNESGSIVRSRAPTIEEHNALKEQVSSLKAVVENLQARLDSNSGVQHVD